MDKELFAKNELVGQVIIPINTITHRIEQYFPLRKKDGTKIKDASLHIILNLQLQEEEEKKDLNILFAIGTFFFFFYLIIFFFIFLSSKIWKSYSR